MDRVRPKSPLYMREKSISSFKRSQHCDAKTAAQKLAQVMAHQRADDEDDDGDVLSLDYVVTSGIGLSAGKGGRSPNTQFAVEVWKFMDEKNIEVKQNCSTLTLLSLIKSGYLDQFAVEVWKFMDEKNIEVKQNCSTLMLLFLIKSGYLDQVLVNVKAHLMSLFLLFLCGLPFEFIVLSSVFDSWGAVGVISALMVVEVNNIKQQEHKRCKYCLGTGYVSNLPLHRNGYGK